MARRVDVKLVDDLDGGDAAGTVRFELDGIAYEIDLSAENAGALRDAFAPYVAAGRRSGRAVPAGAPRRPSGGDRERAQAIRAWAHAQGIEVADRGRIAGEIVAAYERRGSAGTEPMAEAQPTTGKKAAMPVFSSV